MRNSNTQDRKNPSMRDFLIFARPTSKTTILSCLIWIRMSWHPKELRGPKEPELPTLRKRLSQKSFKNLKTLFVTAQSMCCCTKTHNEDRNRKRETLNQVSKKLKQRRIYQPKASKFMHNNSLLNLNKP